MGGSEKNGMTRNKGYTLLVACIAECLGTATLMAIGCMGCVLQIYTVIGAQWAPFVFGLAVATAIQIFGHISGGHFNPAVTIAAKILNKIDWIAIPFYWISQIVGAIIGYGYVHSVTPRIYRDGLCLTYVHPQVETYQAVLVESVSTAFLVWLCCAVWDHRLANQTDSLSLRLGLMLSGLFVAASQYTGCSLNPARSLAPAIFHNSWESHWIYWVAPTAGSIVSALIYKYSFIEGLSKLGKDA